MAAPDSKGTASDDDDKSGDGADKKIGRRKISIEFIEDKSRRHITFSKRKAGIMKKAYELSTLTGTQVLLLVASETGHVYTFATPKLQPLITKTEGKNLIQSCLNAPDPPNARIAQASESSNTFQVGAAEAAQYAAAAASNQAEEDKAKEKAAAAAAAASASPANAASFPFPASAQAFAGSSLASFPASYSYGLPAQVPSHISPAAAPRYPSNSPAGTWNPPSSANPGSYAHNYGWTGNVGTPGKPGPSSPAPNHAGQQGGEKMVGLGMPPGQSGK